MKKLTTFLTVVLMSVSLFTSAQDNARKTDLNAIGAPISTANAITTDDLVMLMKNSEPQVVTVKGRIISVCQKKGCWMKLETSSGELLHVTFKDYGFFMPKDLSGKEVVMEGKAWVNVTPVDELKHYAEDEGKSKKEIAKITQPKKEVRFEAKGVVIL
jgi:hypothetical protein